VLHEKTIDGHLEKVGEQIGAKGAELKVHGMELVKKVAAGVYAQLAAKGATDADPASAPAAPPKAAKTPKAD